ncbi:hypothetical protein Zm00014a_026303 [Zea mays]|uniref:Uncharacterized protein n=2 Tax=Zea mays TaxID=4577 RepID=A0A8J8XAE6_MAIZE|nr:unknown [Zea mays]PWZ54536.1 hypothetical protein Zm00014a_026303 [Zea mays]
MEDIRTTTPPRQPTPLASLGLSSDSPRARGEK